jgi:hypothetical protein
MQTRYSRLGLILSGFYLSLFALTVLYMFYFLAFHPRGSALVAIPAIFVTLPWSDWWLPALNRLGVVAWYDRYTSNAMLYALFSTLAVLPAALPNAIILYFVGWIFDRGKKTG